jgi:hypothetical protein
MSFEILKSEARTTSRIYLDDPRDTKDIRIIRTGLRNADWQDDLN